MTNNYEIDDVLIRIFLTQGKVAIINGRDFNKVNSHPGSWFAKRSNKTFYA